MSEFWWMQAEAKIREAIVKGELDDLPGMGEPLRLDDLTQVPPELRAGFTLLKNNGFLPEEMELKQEILAVEDLINRSVTAEERVELQKKLLTMNLRYRILMERRGRHRK